MRHRSDATILCVLLAGLSISLAAACGGGTKGGAGGEGTTSATATSSSTTTTTGTGGATASSSSTTTASGTGTGGSGGTPCVVSMTDPKNCGACGHDCLGGMCAVGVCQPFALATAQKGAIGIAVDASYVYWVDSQAGNVARVAKTGGKPVVIVPSTPSPNTIAVDATSVYWTTGDSVFKAPIGGGSATTIATGQGSPASLAVDATDAYWVNLGGNRAIGKAPIAGGGTVTVLDAMQPLASAPRALALTATDIYFTIAGGVRKIGKDGTSFPFVANLSTPPTCITLDALNAYVGDGAGNVSSVVLSSGVTKFGVAHTLLPVTAIAVDSGSIYWAAWLSGADGTVAEVPAVGGIDLTLVAGMQGAPLAIVADAQGVYWVNRDGGQVMMVAK